MRPAKNSCLRTSASWRHGTSQADGTLLGGCEVVCMRRVILGVCCEPVRGRRALRVRRSGPALGRDMWMRTRARGVEGESAAVRDALQACRRFDRRGAYMSCAVYQFYEKMSAENLPVRHLPGNSLLNVCMRPKNNHENARGFIQFQEVLPSRVKTSTYYDWFAIHRTANLILSHPQITAHDGRR